MREQLLYYVGRVAGVQYPQVLSTAFRYEAHPLLVRIAALGAILHNDDGVEREFIEKLEPGSQADILNRSVQLVYFGDVRADMYEFIDDGTWPWASTRNGILHRLANTAPRDLRLRWWDLRTLLLFLMSRPKETLSDEEVLRVERAGLAPETTSQDRRESIEAEISKILKHSADTQANVVQRP